MDCTSQPSKQLQHLKGNNSLEVTIRTRVADAARARHRPHFPSHVSTPPWRRSRSKLQAPRPGRLGARLSSAGHLRASCLAIWRDCAKSSSSLPAATRRPRRLAGSAPSRTASQPLAAARPGDRASRRLNACSTSALRRARTGRPHRGVWKERGGCDAQRVGRRGRQARLQTGFNLGTSQTRVGHPASASLS